MTPYEADEEREDFKRWHFQQWALVNVSKDEVDIAEMLYDRVMSHSHNHDIREAQFMAWCGAKEIAKLNAVPEGFVVVPSNPTESMIRCGIDVFCFPLDNGCFGNYDLAEAYLNMIEEGKLK